MHKFRVALKRNTVYLNPINVCAWKHFLLFLKYFKEMLSILFIKVCKLYIKKISFLSLKQNKNVSCVLEMLKLLIIFSMHL